MPVKGEQTQFASNDAVAAGIRELARSVRLHGAIWMVTIVAVLPLALLRPELIDLPSSVVAGVGGLALLSAIVVVLLPWQQIVERPTGRRVIEGYPLAVIALAGSLELFAPWSPIYGLIMLVAAAMGANYVRRNTLVVLLMAPLLVFVASSLRADADVLVVAFLATSTASVTLVTWLNSQAQRDALRSASERRAQASRAARIERLLNAAGSFGSTSGEEVAQALTDAAVTLDWEVCGVHVLDHTRRDDAYVGARGVPINHVGPLASSIHREVMRTGQLVIRPGRKPASLLGRNAEPSMPLIAAPVLVRGALRGVISVGSRSRVTPTNEDVDVLTKLVECAGNAFGVVDDFASREQAVAEIERLGQQKQDFLGTVSHELRTPLAIVLGMAETIDVHWDALPDERRHDMASRLHANAAGLEHVVEALLDYSRLEAGMIQPQRRPVALIDVVVGVVDRLKTLTVGHQVSVVDRERTGKLHAWVDPILLERVVENLVTNACRHTPAGCHVRVEVIEEVDRAVIAVIDDGPGIAAADLEHLGERFYRVGKDATRATRGLGLGLAFCRQVLAMHGSKLQIVSELGKGTTFSFDLAYQQDAELEETLIQL